MSQFLLTEGIAPATPPAGKIAIYVKTDKRMYWKNDAGVETPFKSVGAGSGDLLADGTIPLTSNWDVGAFQITALRFHSDEVTLPPFTVVSTAVVANLNADLLDGIEGAAHTKNADTDLTANVWFLDEDTLVSDDATKAASQQSIKAYVDNSVVGLLQHKGGYDAATNTPDLDTSPSGIKQGDAYVVTVAGTFYAVALEIGDWLYANQDDPVASAHWTMVQANLDAAGVKTLYESNADTNEYSDSEQTIVSNAIVDSDISEAEGFIRKTGAGAYEAVKSNLTATTDPDADEDSGDGYGVGSEWFNVTLDKFFICLDATAAAAVWKLCSPPTGYLSQNLQTGTAYELVLADAGIIVEMNNASANILTIPANSSVGFPVDTRIDVEQYGVGQTTIAITTDTLRGLTKIAIQYGMVSLWKRTATEWVVVGGVV